MSHADKLMTEVVFLFGAGASVDADVPDTYNFVTAFEEFIQKHHPELSEQLSSILKVIEEFNERNSVKEQQKVDVEQLLYTLRRLIERKRKNELLSPKFLFLLDRLSFSLNKFEAFCEYMGKLANGVNFHKYTESLETDSSEVKSFIDRIEIAVQRGFYDGNAGEPNSIILGVARGRLKTFLEGDSLQLELR